MQWLPGTGGPCLMWEVAVNYDVCVTARVGERTLAFLCKMASGGTPEQSFTTDELLRHYASIEAQGESVLLDRQQVCTFMLNGWRLYTLCIY